MTAMTNKVRISNLAPTSNRTKAQGRPIAEMKLVKEVNGAECP